MRNLFRRGLFLDAAGAPAGGAVTPAPVVAPPAAGTGTPPAGAPAEGNGTPNPTAAQAARFDWKTLNLDADAQAVVDTHQWENPNAVVRSYANLHKMTSLPPDRLLKLPNEKSTPEELKEFRTKIGVPEKATDYKLPVPEGDAGEFAREAENWMHEAGVPQSAAVKIASKWNDKMAATKKANDAAITARNDKEMGELKNEWGADYQQNEAMVDRAAQEFGMTKEQLDGLRTAMGPKAALKFMQTIGARVGTEGEFIDADKGGAAGFQGNMTSAQAKSEISRLKGDRAFQEMYASKDPTTRREARATMDRLNRLAAPGMVEFPGAIR